MGRLNQYAVDNGDVEVQNSDFALEYTSDSVTDTYTTTIKSIDDDEMYQILELFHSEHYYDLLDVYLHMIQDRLVVSPY